jgi:hypothetical protein
MERDESPKREPSRRETILVYILDHTKTPPNGKSVGEFMREQRAELARLSDSEVATLLHYTKSNNTMYVKNGYLVTLF